MPAIFSRVPGISESEQSVPKRACMAIEIPTASLREQRHSSIRKLTITSTSEIADETAASSSDTKKKSATRLPSGIFVKI